MIPRTEKPDLENRSSMVHDSLSENCSQTDETNT